MDIIEQYREEQKAQAERAKGRRLKKYQRKALERGMRLVTPKKPHDGPCFAPRKVVAGFDNEGKPLFETKVEQTGACAKYHLNEYLRAVERVVNAVRATSAWRNARLENGEVDEEKREALETAATERIDRKDYPWVWHPGRGLGAQEIDTLLMKSYPVDTPEQRRRALGFIYGRRGRRLMHPSDYAEAIDRVERAGSAA